MPEESESSAGLGAFRYFRVLCLVGRDSVVGIGSRYGLCCLGIEYRRGGEIFRISSDRSWGPPSLLCNGYHPFSRGKTAGVWHLPPPPSNAEVKERVELYLYFLWGIVACYRVNCTFFTFYCVCLESLLACILPVSDVCGLSKNACTCWELKAYSFLGTW